MSDCAQRSPEWYEIRCGRVTASRVADIVSKGRGKAESARRRNYRAEIITERLTGQVIGGFQSAAMEWGTITENEARDAYAEHSLCTVEEVGFVIHPTIPMAGASPDGLVGVEGEIEIKCPTSLTQVTSLAEHYEMLGGAGIDPDYLIQMQWQMACTARQWCDFISYDPRLPGSLKLMVQRVQRDDEVITMLEAEVLKFLTEVEETVAALRKQYEPQLEIAA
jgi:putative phage-type endonuclease